MSTKKFKVEGIGGYGKSLYLTGPFDLAIEIDYDDVDHPVVEKQARKLCKLLNTYWNATVANPVKRNPKLVATPEEAKFAVTGALDASMEAGFTGGYGV